jgi:signal transduction histidine kinase
MTIANISTDLAGRLALSSLFSEITPAMVSVLDEKRRILYANGSLLRFLGVADANNVIGRGFCDCLKCEHPSGETDGDEHCAYCSLHGALAQSKPDETAVHDISLRNHTGQTFVFRVQTRNAAVDGTNVLAVLMHDISDEKRRETLEHTFFHDLLNTASGILGLLRIVEQEVPDSENARNLLHTAKNCAEYLVEEIDFSRALSYAEKSSLKLNPEPVDPNTIVEKACGFFTMFLRMSGVSLNIMPAEKSQLIITDPTILTRILINLVKNALEASRRGENVSVRAARDETGNALFEVHNNAFMPRETQENIFVRAFSTKGRGRGIGTYSVRLFTEEYLKGRVWFTSDETLGTSFFVQVPDLG